MFHFPLDVAVAVVVALPTLAKDVVALSRSGNVSQAIPARFFRLLDKKLDHLLAPLSYLSIAYLLARAAATAVLSPLSPLWKASAVLACLSVALGTLLPLLWIFNSLGSLFWRNPPLHMDKAAFFPASAKFEDPQTWKKLRAELDACGPSGTRRFLDVFGGVAFIQPKSEDANGKSRANGEAKSDSKDKSDPAEDAVADGWRTLFLRFGGRDHEANRDRLPVLASLLDGMPEVYNAFYSILQPGVSLAPHRGYCKAFIRYHLGMVVPEPDKATLIVGGQRYRWKEGEGVLFDDMFVHAVENHCSKPRIVLFLDVRRRTGLIGGLISDVVEWAVDRHPYHLKIRDRI
jgi:hypothetical protein